MNRHLPVLALAAASVMLGQGPLSRQTAPPPGEGPPVRLPNGKLQSDEVLKQDHQKNLKEADELMKLSEEVKVELEKNERFVLSVGTLKKLEQIEKLAKSMRSRLKRF
jgi:hypothetical protein